MEYDVVTWGTPVQTMEYDLINTLNSKMKQLEVSVKQLRKSGTDYAEAERTYKLILTQECLRLRDEGMAIGLIDKIAYGIPKVADARFDRDVKSAIFVANKESINAIKLAIRVISEQIKQEWGAELSD